MSASTTWPYHFLTLTPEKVAERRHLLTQRGIYTQLSALAIIICVGIYRFYVTKFAKREPRVRGEQKAWLDRPLARGWSETRKQYLLCFVWLAWIIWLTVWKTGDGWFSPFPHPTPDYSFLYAHPEDDI